MAAGTVAATTRAAQRTLAGDHALAAATKPGGSTHQSVTDASGGGTLNGALSGALTGTGAALCQYPESDGLCRPRSGGTFLSRTPALSRDQQRRLARAALSAGGSGPHGAPQRCGPEAVLSAAGATTRAAQGQGGREQKTTHPRLHHVA